MPPSVIPPPPGGKPMRVLMLLVALSTFAYYILHSSTSDSAAPSALSLTLKGNGGGEGGRVENIISTTDVYKDVESLLDKLQNEHRVIEDYIKIYEKKLEVATNNINLRKDTSAYPSSSSNAPPNIPLNDGLNQVAKLGIGLPASTDNFGSSSSEGLLKAPISFSSMNSELDRQQSPKSVLVIGGTDGSGTRQVVKLLTSLGVTIVSEDPETFDIHADLIGGWPPVVNRVLSHFKSINYDPESLDVNYKESVTRDAHRLLKQVERDSHKPTSYQLAIGGVLPKKIDADCSHILHGFKAPISMTMVPLFANQLPHFKFLHVLRDGRDIAFSVNQGPVQKFWRNMYGNHFDYLNQPEKAMKLWSDWNSQIYTWSRETAKKYKENQDGKYTGKSYEYLAVHTEDILSSDISVKFSMIKHLADLVGSSMTDLELCCLSMDDVEFMGSHDRTERSNNKDKQSEQVKSRYGKWKGILSQNVNLKNSLHSIGEVGLKTFGYEPLREFSGQGSATATGFVCSVDIIRENRNTIKCPAALKYSTTRASGQNSNINSEINIDNARDIANKNNFVHIPVPAGIVRLKTGDFQLPPPLATSPYATPGVCQVYQKVDFKGGDLYPVSVPGERLSECCEICKQKEVEGCRYFTFDVDSNQCYLKLSRGTPAFNERGNLISGDLV